MKRVLLAGCLGLLMSGLFSACSSITVLRTREIKAVGDNVRSDVNREMDSLRTVIDSLRMEQARYNDRLKADLATLNSRIVDESESGNARMEEILYRLDLLMNKSEKILSKRVVVDKRDSEPTDSSSVAAQQTQEMENLYNTARADYHRGEFKLAYGGFKQVYETLKTGELSENALYWMGLCMQDAGQAANAKTLFMRVVDQYPQGVKLCVTLYKLATIAEDEGNVELQKQYLQRLLSLKNCSDSNEFQKSAEKLESMLNNAPVSPSTSSSSAGTP